MIASLHIERGHYLRYTGASKQGVSNSLLKYTVSNGTRLFMWDRHDTVKKKTLTIYYRFL